MKESTPKQFKTNDMKHLFLLKLLILGSMGTGWCQTIIDLKPIFDADAILESGGTGLGNALDAAGRRIDAGSLPAAYADGSTVTTQDGRAKFQFGTLKQSSLDAVMINGQVLNVPQGSYASLDLAMLSAPGGFGNPFTQVELRYMDGSKQSQRLGPVAGWFNSPTAFDHTVYRFTDSSQVQIIRSFRTDFGDMEAPYVFQERGNGNAGGNRFVDGTGYVLYRIGDLGALSQAKLGITVGNNFVISLAAEFHDPDVSTTEGFTVVANSMDLYGGFEHRALGNLKQYDFDVSSYLAQGTGELYILFTDATPSNGWGPFIQQISLFTGTAVTFEETLQPVVDNSKATIYATFRAGDTEPEKPYLFDNSGSGPSNRGHRFADAAGSITYQFDLPDNVTTARLTVDMANNFVVSLSGPSDIVRYQSMSPGTPEEQTMLIDTQGSALTGDARFADGNGYMVYQFDLPDEVTNAFAQVHIGNEFVIAAAAGTNGEFQVVKDWVAETGQETHDNSNLDFYFVDLAPFLTNNPSKIVQLRFTDGVTTDGWGPYLKSIVIVNKKESTSQFQTVLNSQELYGEDVRDESNKKYYTIDLSPMLTNNPGKQVLVKFTDGSTGDGWGPGIFWMAVYSGEIDIQSDRLVFNNLKTTTSEPANSGVALLHRRYAVNSSKTLSAVALSSHPATEDSKVYLLAATLNAGATSVQLQVSRIADNKLRLAWPSGATGYHLQYKANLDSPIQWLDVQDAPQTVGAEFVIEVTLLEAARYYRLVNAN